MQDLIARLAAAIFRQEGMPPDHKNPGNLRAAPWLSRPLIEHGFWKPASRAEGIAGAQHCIALRVARGESLRQLITAWAPPSDGNNTSAYIMNVAGWCSLSDIEVPLMTYFEGYIPT